MPPFAPQPAPGAHPTILLVGDVMLDRYHVGTVERVSPEAPVPVLKVGRSFVRPGGAGNVAVNVAAMGGRAILVGCVGIDAAADQLRGVLEAEGVSAEHLIATAAIPTSAKTRLLATHQQIARFDEEQTLTDAAASQQLIAHAQAAVAGADLVILSDYAKGVCDQALCRAVIAAARKRNVPVIVDPKGADFSKYSGASILTPNRSEAAIVTGIAIHGPDDAIHAAEAIRARFAIDAVVVTLGEQGMVLVSAAGASVIPTQAKRVFDVTGAGDTVVAALAVATCLGSSRADACYLANAAAGLKVAQIGTVRISWSEILESIVQQHAVSQGKVLPCEALCKAVRVARGEGQSIGFTNGCFDILHHGHVALLEAAARECDLLVVGVNSDASVRRLKGPPRPYVPAGPRMAVLAALSCVAWVTEFDEDTPLELIKAIQPDVLVKGADYAVGDVVGGDIVRAAGGKVVTPVFLQGVSTTNIVGRILSTHTGG